MFDPARFVEDCQAAAAGGEAQTAVRELVARAVSDPESLARVLGDPEHAGLHVLYRGAHATIIRFVWAPWMSVKPHTHEMWSVVGIFSGREDSLFWRRKEGTIEAAGARSLGRRDVAVLGRDIIHSVVNPLGKRTRALHVYGGDFFAPPTPRSEWDHESLVERPWDMDDTRRLFRGAEARAQARDAGT